MILHQVLHHGFKDEVNIHGLVQRRGLVYDGVYVLELCKSLCPC